MGPSGVERLLAAPFISHLEHLDLGGNNLGSEGYRILARSKKLGRIRALFLNANAIEGDALAEPNDVDWLASLDVLDLTMNPLGAEGARALSEIRREPKWMALFLLGCAIGPKGAAELAHGPAWPRLVVLSLGGNAIGDLGVSELARSNRFPQLVTLDLAANAISDEGATALADQYNRTNQLAAIDLIGNLFTDEGRESLVNRFGSRVRF
jgi:Ran GTPase-activating protein (RanGAP) involved in mRNA processing and transport